MIKKSPLIESLSTNRRDTKLRLVGNSIAGVATGGFGESGKMSDERGSGSLSKGKTKPIELKEY